MTILFVPSSSERVAASRTRAYAYVPHLSRRGFHCRVFPILSDSASREMFLSPTYRLPRKVAYYARVMLERTIRSFFVLALVPFYDIVYFQRAAFPFAFAWAIRRLNPRIIFDFDDAIFMADPTSNETGFLGRLKDRLKAAEVEAMVRLSRCVIVENAYLKEYAERFSSDVRVISGPVETKKYEFHPRTPGARVVVGWVGSPSTAPFLEMVRPALLRLVAEEKVELRFIGTGDFRLEGVPATYLEWTPETEVRELQGFDIGLMPMPDNEWTRGKLGHKMLLYMSAGAVTAASYTPATAAVLHDGVNGVIVKPEEDWYAKLDGLAADAGLRARFAEAGRKTATEHFSMDKAVERLCEVLDDLSPRSAEATASGRGG